MPLLIHIGYHKTGTSWLQKFLFRNPDAGFGYDGKRTDSPINRLVTVHPLDFHAGAAIAEFARPIEAIRGRGLVPVVSLERLSGHPFSGGYDSKEIAQRLAAVFPGGRVLMVFREQQTMIVSTYKQYIKAGGALTLARFLEPPRHHRLRTTQFDLRHFEYDRLLQLYCDLFGPGSVLALPYERLRADPRGFVDAIGRFCGARPQDGALEALPFDQRPNLAAQAAAVTVHRVLNRWFVTADTNPAPLLPWSGAVRFVARAAGALDRLVPTRAQRQLDRRMREVVRRVAQGRYGESNVRTSRISGINLTQYAYEMASPMSEPEVHPIERAEANT